MNKSVLGVLAGGVVGLAVGIVLNPRATPSLPSDAMAKAQPEQATERVVRLEEGLAKRANIQVEPVSKRKLSPTLSLVGSVAFDADAVADVGGRIEGRITRMLVSVGDKVKEGQPLVEIEGNQLGEAIAEFLSARANLIAAENQAARETELGAKQLSSAPVVERAKAEAQAVRAEMRGAEQRLLAMGLTAKELKDLETGDGPRRITLRAPIAGEVVQRYAVLGQVVDPTQPVLRIADLTQLWVELDVFERDLANVAIGNSVEIVSETHPGKIFAGQVSYVDAQVDVATRAAQVRIEVENPDRLLRPGQFVHARLSTQGDSREAVTIPRSAVLRVDGETSVFLKVGKNAYAPRPVELGPAVGDFVEIVRGLAVGDQLVTAGGFVLKSELER